MNTPQKTEVIKNAQRQIGSYSWEQLVKVKPISDLSNSVQYKLLQDLSWFQESALAFSENIKHNQGRGGRAKALDLNIFGATSNRLVQVGLTHAYSVEGGKYYNSYGHSIKPIDYYT